MDTLASVEAKSVTEGIVERTEQGTRVLSPAYSRPVRRVLFVNSYGGAPMWDIIKKGLYPPHHLWGCLELVRMGYEVALADPSPDFNPRRPLPHDLKLLKMAREWLGPDDILYCGHNVLYWLPFLKNLGVVHCRIISLLYACEPLAFSRAHSGVIALNPAAETHARKLAPDVKVAHLAWGVDLNFFPALDYSSEWFLSCGKTHRDHHTLFQAASRCRSKIRVISPDLPLGLPWPPNVQLVTGGRYDDTVSYRELLHDYYSRCAGSLIILKNDPEQHTAVGFTNLLESMAMGRPVIVTKTGALPTEFDLEGEGCGYYVPAEDPAALAAAMKAIVENPERAAAMGRAGRRLCETRYNINRYANDLHQFFDSL